MCLVYQYSCSRLTIRLRKKRGFQRKKILLRSLLCYFVVSSFLLSSNSKHQYCMLKSNLVKYLYPLCCLITFCIFGRGYCFRNTLLFNSRKSVTICILSSFLGLQNEGAAHQLSSVLLVITPSSIMFCSSFLNISLYLYGI